MNYSFTGVDTSGAETFSVDYFRTQAPLASQVFAQQLTEALKDVILAQSPMDFSDNKGQLQYKGSIIGYDVKPVSVESDETASYTRLSITVKIEYTNEIEKDKSFERSFTEYADFESSLDLFSIEEELWEEITDKLVQSIYNASLGNW
jgi:hypothetical protein